MIHPCILMGQSLLLALSSLCFRVWCLNRKICRERTTPSIPTAQDTPNIYLHIMSSKISVNGRHVLKSLRTAVSYIWHRDEGTKEIPAERNLGLGVIGLYPTHIPAQQQFLTLHGGPSHCSHRVIISLTLHPDNTALLIILSLCCLTLSLFIFH